MDATLARLDAMIVQATRDGYETNVVMPPAALREVRDELHDYQLAARVEAAERNRAHDEIERLRTALVEIQRRAVDALAANEREAGQ